MRRSPGDVHHHQPGGLRIDAFTPIINPPQVGILGVGRVVEKPVVYQGEITKRSMMFLSLTLTIG